MRPPRDSRARIVQLHPEHLFDKLGTGQLTSVEQRQLWAHTAKCATCRFELLVREDLALESSKQATEQDANNWFQRASDA